jgi:hypothetical protein
MPADRVRAVLPHGEAVTERQMFGGLPPKQAAPPSRKRR